MQESGEEGSGRLIGVSRFVFRKGLFASHVESSDLVMGKDDRR